MPTSSASNSILSYLFSLIGFVPIHQVEQMQQQQQREKQYYKERKKITSTTKEEESCQYLNSSTFVIQQEQEEKDNLVMQDWLFNLSKMALCQILTSTIADYPQVADGIYNRHYEKNFYMKRKQIIATPIVVDSIQQLQLFRNKIKKIAHSLDNLRPSEQFGRASEVANALFQLLYSPPIVNTLPTIPSVQLQQSSSFISLFALIILSQESLNCPSEVRQHLFSDVKYGRSVILEMSKVLKNFCHTHGDIQYKWASLSSLEDSTTSNWHETLEFVCTKLSRYDVTWEYRKEYQEVVNISKRYYNIYSSTASSIYYK